MALTTATPLAAGPVRAKVNGSPSTSLAAGRDPFRGVSSLMEAEPLAPTGGSFTEVTVRSTVVRPDCRTPAAAR